MLDSIESLLIHTIWTIVQDFQEGTKMDGALPLSSPTSVVADDISHNHKTSSNSDDADGVPIQTCECHTPALDKVSNGVTSTNAEYNKNSSLQGNHDREPVPANSERIFSPEEIEEHGRYLYETAASLSGHDTDSSLDDEDSVKSKSTEMGSQRENMHDKPDDDSPVSISSGDDDEDADPPASQAKGKRRVSTDSPIKFEDEDDLCHFLLRWIEKNPDQNLPGSLKFNADRMNNTPPNDAYASEDLTQKPIGEIERLRVNDNRMGWILRCLDDKLIWLLRANNFVRGYAQYRGWLGIDATFTTEPIAYTTRPQVLSHGLGTGSPAEPSFNLRKRRASKLEQGSDNEAEETSVKKRVVVKGEADTSGSKQGKNSLLPSPNTAL